MKKVIRILVGISCVALLFISWVIASESKSAAEKQLILIQKATEMMDEGVFIRAVPLLEEAAGYDAKYTLLAEDELKTAYLALIDKRGFSRKYLALLEKQTNSKDALPHVFIEKAEYYIEVSKFQEAFEVMRKGIEKTGDENIVTLYENTRYIYEINRPVYENVTELYNKTIQVQLDGKWGIAGDNGVLIIPCMYDKISNFYQDRAIVQISENIYAIDRENNRIFVADQNVSDFKNLADNRVPLLINENWIRASGDFELGTSVFEEIGMYSEGYTAAKINGKWGVIGIADKWFLPAEFDGIIPDEMGRCFAQGVVFVRSGKSVFLFTDGAFLNEPYEDAHAFNKEGYAAVKKNGKWGFIDTNGVPVIPFVFEDAMSFGQHLAAVKIGDHWGYINKQGNVVIDAIFHNAKSFSEGSAPVLTDRGWQIITLVEFKKGANL